MILLFLIITTFFIPISCLLRCIGGPNCHIKLSFNQTLPTNKELLEICSIIETSSCSVYLRVDYTDQQVYISFEESSVYTESPHPSIDLLETNPQASIVLRYTVKIRIHNNNKFHLYVLLQCRTNNQCSDKQLRHYWPRFISLNNRQNSFHSFSELLVPINSNIITCFDDRINQTVQCSIPNNICWASTNTPRKCTNHSNEFIYSYNKVERPHQLTDEDVHYTLACHANNCNNNETIHRKKKNIISPPPSHIPRGKTDFADVIFLSPSIYYSSDTAYATPFKTDDDIVQVVLECSVKINCFTSYPSTVPTYTAHPGEDPKTIEWRIQDPTQIKILSVLFISKASLKKIAIRAQMVKLEIDPSM